MTGLDYYINWCNCVAAKESSEKDLKEFIYRATRETKSSRVILDDRIVSIEDDGKVYITPPIYDASTTVC